jgi:hypothetical protein
MRCVIKISDPYAGEIESPKFDLQAQEIADSIIMSAKDCKPLMAGIKAVEDFGPAYVKSIIKAYSKLKNKES